jgi:hypothetical protein
MSTPPSGGNFVHWQAAVVRALANELACYPHADLHAAAPGRYQVLHVDDDVTIRDFVEDHLDEAGASEMRRFFWERYGTTMRGRHSAAILRMIDVTDTIAATVDDYIAIATRLGQDTQFRQTMSSRMAENRHRLYGDRAPVTALENFLEGAVRG